MALCWGRVPANRENPTRATVGFRRLKISPPWLKGPISIEGAARRADDPRECKTRWAGRLLIALPGHSGPPAAWQGQSIHRRAGPPALEPVDPLVIRSIRLQVRQDIRSPGRPVYRSSSLRVNRFASLSVCQSTSLPVCQSASHPVCQSTSPPVIRSIGLPVHQSSSHPVIRSSSHPVYRSTGLPVYQISGIPDILERKTMLLGIFICLTIW